MPGTREGTPRTEALSLRPVPTLSETPPSAASPRVSRAPLLHRTIHWSCPNCTTRDVTTEVEPHTRFHACRGLRGLTSPLVEDGVRCAVTAVDREDYVGGESVQRDGEGRPVMAVVTTRDDGQDRAVFAPTATLTGHRR